MKPDNVKISVVIPCYNEENCVEIIIQKTLSVLQTTGYGHEIWLVNDGSKDNTELKLQELSEKHSEVHWLSFSRNFGHQAALKAGLDYATGDCVITMDGDMQHPPELIPKLVSYWEEGYDIVNTRRQENEQTSWFKKVTSRNFYYIQNLLSDIELEPGAADFRLLDRKVIDVLLSLEETDIFYRGLIQWVGFKTHTIDYVVGNRVAGESKYSLSKMATLAINGITSFSTKPLYIAVYIGIFFAFLSLLYLPYAVWVYLSGDTVSGWTSQIMTIVFFGGLQLIILGIIGIYISKIFKQVKKRPVYIVRKTDSKNNHP